MPVAGTFTVARNTTVRAGVLDPNWQFGVGAIWFDGRDRPMTNTINVTDLRLIDSSYEAIHIMGSGVSGLHFDGVGIEGAGTFALQLQTTGGASFRAGAARTAGCDFLRIARVISRGWPTADWEFRHGTPHARAHVLIRGVVPDATRAYLLHVSAADSRWAADKRLFNNFVGTFSSAQ